jgi:hypothetical protein
LFSVCDEPKVTSSSDNQEKIYTKIQALNDVLNQLFQRWATNLSHLREISVAMIQFGTDKQTARAHSIQHVCSFRSTDPSLPETADQQQDKVAEILAAFQAGALIHCGSYLV